MQQGVFLNLFFSQQFNIKLFYIFICLDSKPLNSVEGCPGENIL